MESTEQSVDVPEEFTENVENSEEIEEAPKIINENSAEKLSESIELQENENEDVMESKILLPPPQHAMPENLGEGTVKIF